MFKFKGVNIDDFKICKVSGDGLCGANCLVLHMTTLHDGGHELRKSINAHKILNWQFYKESYSNDNTERFGNSTRYFRKSEDFLNFLKQEPDEAAKHWMGQTDIQAAANMFNMKVNILTIGIPKQPQDCHHCKPSKKLKDEEELINHNDKNHEIKETDEEKEGR